MHDYLLHWLVNLRRALLHNVKRMCACVDQRTADECLGRGRSLLVSLTLPGLADTAARGNIGNDDCAAWINIPDASVRADPEG